MDVLQNAKVYVKISKIKMNQLYCEYIKGNSDTQLHVCALFFVGCSELYIQLSLRTYRCSEAIK